MENKPEQNSTGVRKLQLKANYRKEENFLSTEQKIANSENSSENGITFIEKLDFNDWLKVQWSYQWRSTIKISLIFIIFLPILFFLKMINKFANTYQADNIVVSLLIVAAVFLMLFANSIMLKSLLNVKYDNFKIIVTDPRHNEIKYNELDIISRYSLAWGLLWREFIILIVIQSIFTTITIFIIMIFLLILKVPISSLYGFIIDKRNIIQLATMTMPSYFSIGFIFNIVLMKQLVKAEFYKFRLAVIKVENPYPVRNIYLTVIIISSIIASIFSIFLNFVFFLKPSHLYNVLHIPGNSALYLSILSILFLISCIAVLKWKKWGFFLYLICFIAIMSSNIYFGTGILLIITPVINLIVFTYMSMKQWKLFN